MFFFLTDDSALQSIERFQSIVPTVHVGGLVAPVCSGGGVVVATRLFQQKSDVFLANNAHVQQKWRLQGTDEYVGIEQPIDAQPRKDQKHPGHAHDQEHESEHDEAGRENQKDDYLLIRGNF